MNKELSKLTTIVIVTINGNISYEVIDRIYDKYKIIIIENNLDYNFKKKVNDKYPDIEIIIPNENVGFGAGNNIGIKKTLTPYVLLLGPDVSINLENIVSLEYYAQKLENFSILTPNSNGFYDLLLTSLDRLDKNFKAKINTDNEISEIPWVPEWCMYCNVLDLKNIDFFDESFFLYFEGLDLCKRLKKAGKNFYLINNNMITHHFHGTSSNLEDKKTKNHWKLRNWHFYWSSFYYHKKNYSYIKSVFVHLSKFLRFFIKQYYYLLTGNKNGYIYTKSKSDGILSAFLKRKSSYRTDL